jgi:hypothetical protein
MAHATEGKAKFVDLAEGGYVDKQKYTDDLAARDTRITTLDDTIKLRDTDLANLRQQLTDAGNDATKLDELNVKFSELQKQYDKDTKAYQKQLKDQAYKHAVNNFANQQAFTSQAAKRDFINSMLAKNLQIENDVLIGATEFMTTYAGENADAFVQDKPADPPANKPHFVDSTNNNGSNDGGNTDLFNFNFVGVRPHK